MSEPEVIDAEPVESRELVTVPTLAVTPQVEAAELVARLAVIRDAMDTAMEKDVDYGVIPGTNKPTLLKPGAEKLSVLFQLDVQLENEKTWGPGDHLTVVAKATVFHAPSGARLGYGEGVCTTRERKYAYRKQERVCPSCDTAAVIKGKADFGGGWVCWKKRDGCGASFKDGDGAIENQEAGEIDNPDLPDLWNTVVKMAEKRARVDAVLAVSGASALFTQDAEDTPQASADKPARSTRDKPSDGQLKFLKDILDGKARGTQKPSLAQLNVVLMGLGIGFAEPGWMDKLTRGECSSLLDKLTKEQLPSVEHPTDVPVDAKDFEVEPQPPLETLI